MPRIKPRTLSLGERAELRRLQTAYKARLARNGNKDIQTNTMVLKPSRLSHTMVERSIDNN